MDRQSRDNIAQQDYVTREIHEIAGRGGITPTEVRDHYNAGMDLDTLDEGSVAWARLNPIAKRIRNMSPVEFDSYTKTLRRDQLQESIRREVRSRTLPVGSGYGIWSAMSDGEFERLIVSERAKANKRAAPGGNW